MLPVVTPAGKGKVNTRVDNIGYWSRMVKLGYVNPNPKTETPPAIFNGTKINPYYPPITRHASRVTPSLSRVTRHASPLSPDIPVTGETDVTQSENSLFIDPEDEDVVLNSNNSSSWIMGYAETPFGADALYSLDNGQDWGGSTDGVNGINAGDPSTAIGRNGWWYVGRITGDYGQAVSYSKDKGKSWKRVKVGQGPTTGLGLLDKNHLWIDNSVTSPFEGFLYDAWTNFIPGSPDTNQVQIVRSTDHGLTWSAPYTISLGVAAQKLNHGVNLQTGPGGQLYAAWSIYDSWPADETAIGFARSVDGGGIFSPATRIITNIKGIRASMTSKNMRVSSFPCMAVDNSTGPNRGTIYIAWTNAGVPGINTGNDIDIYLIKSADQGATWSAPVKVNQDPPGLGKQHFLPWITVDAVTGGLCVVYYDDRNADSTKAAVFVSTSYDGGNSWTDMQVSDYTFTPEPIPGLAFSYFGDYIGIQSNNMKVYPIWTDNHEGRAMAYVSPFDLGPNPNQPWLTYYADSLAPVNGSGNTTMNYGDSLFLTLSLKNIGDQPAVNVITSISTASPYIVITDSVAPYGTIDPAANKAVTNGYTFKVSDTIPDNLMVRFDVKATGSDSVWYSHFALEAHAPALQINNLTIVDTLNGNRNGRLDPGETARLVVPVVNSGDFDCQGTFGLLSSASPYLTLSVDSVYLETINPGHRKNAVFTVTADAATPIGSGADLLFKVHSGSYKAARTFRVMIGQVVEDWETNTFTRYPWHTAGSKPWTTTSLHRWEGNYGSQSGAITDYQNSQMYLTYSCATADSISFYISTSSEQDYDFLQFVIDGVLQDQWSGETPWTRVSFPVAAGEHVFKWIYLKDLAYYTGLDRVWVDFIALPPPVLPVVDPGLDDTICAGEKVMLQASASQYDSIRWSTTGDGIFGNDTLLATWYIPGTGDLVSGNVNLRLTGFSAYGSFGKDKSVRIHPRPLASVTAVPGDTVCAGQSILLKADTAGVATWKWIPGNYTSASAAYDTANAGGTGSHLIKLITSNIYHCENRDSLYLQFKNCTGMEEPEYPVVSIYPNPTSGWLHLEVETPQPGPMHLTISNDLNMVVFRYDDPVSLKQRDKIFNLKSLPDGLYLLSLTTSHGTTAHKLIMRK